MEMHDEDKKVDDSVSVEEVESKDMKKSFKKKLEKKDEEIKRLQIENEHYKNEYFRAYADTQNLRKTLEKDHQEAIKYRAEGFIEGLLPILDSFYMALEGSKPSSKEIENYLVGFRYIYKNLVAVLENEGVSEIDPKECDKFDPLSMNAIETIYDEGEENIVKKVYSRGYKLHSRIVRPSLVVVSTHIKKEDDSKTESNSTNNNENN